MNTFYQVLIVYGIIGFVSWAVYSVLRLIGKSLSTALPKDGEL